MNNILKYAIIKVGNAIRLPIVLLLVSKTSFHHGMENPSQTMMALKTKSDGIQRFTILQHLLRHDDHKNSYYSQNLYKDWRETVNSLDVELAVHCVLPVEIQQKISEYISADNVFISSYLKAIKQLPNVIQTSFHALTGVCAAVFYQGTIIIGGSYVDNIIHIQNPINERTIATLSGQPSRVRAMAQRGDVLLTGDDSGIIKAWHLPSKTCLFTLRTHQLMIKKLLIHDTLLISGSLDGKITVWDLETRKCIKILTKHIDKIDVLIMVADYLVSGSYDAINIWDLKSGECLQTDTKSACSLATIDSNTFISASKDCFRIHTINPSSIKQVDVEQGKAELISFVSPNLIIIASLDGLLTFYEYPSLTLLAEIKGHTQRLFFLNAQGNIITTMSQDDHIKNWDLSLLKNIPRLNKFFRHNLTFPLALLLSKLGMVLKGEKTYELSEYEVEMLKKLKLFFRDNYGPLAAIILDEKTKAFLP